MGTSAMQMGSNAAEEGSSLSKVMWFGIIQLVGIVAGWIAAYFLFTSFFLNFGWFQSLGAHPTPADVAKALGPLFQNLIYILPIALGIELIALVLLTLGFRGLARVDRSKFGISTPFMVILMVGIIIAGGAAAVILNDIPGLIANAPGAYQSGTPSAAFFNSLSSIFVYFGLLALGGLLALIGFIGGPILGLWRVGSRYNQTIIKVGAIFEIIPGLNIIAPILIILGANEAKGMLTR